MRCQHSSFSPHKNLVFCGLFLREQMYSLSSTNGGSLYCILSPDKLHHTNTDTHICTPTHTATIQNQCKQCLYAPFCHLPHDTFIKRLLRAKGTDSIEDISPSLFSRLPPSFSPSAPLMFLSFSQSFLPLPLLLLFLPPLLLPPSLISFSPSLLSFPNPPPLSPFLPHTIPPPYRAGCSRFESDSPV